MAALDRYLRELMNNRETIFGGKLLVLGGDFRQILPVIPHGRIADIVQACFKSSELWDHVEKLSLTRNMRVERKLRLQDDTHANRQRLTTIDNWLKDVGEGKVPTIHGDIIRLDASITVSKEKK